MCAKSWENELCATLCYIQSIIIFTNELFFLCFRLPRWWQLQRKLSLLISNAIGECVLFFRIVYCAVRKIIFFVKFLYNSILIIGHAKNSASRVRLCSPTLESSDRQVMLKPQELSESPGHSVRWPFRRADSVHLSSTSEPTCFIISSG